MDTKLYTIILAAGEGKRMKSDIPKVFHPIGGLPMIEYILRRAIDLPSDKVIVVVGIGKEIIMDYVAKRYEDAIFVHQDKQLGTADAVRSASQELSELEGDVLILNGDVPLIKHVLIKDFYEQYKASKASLGFITSTLDNPEGYGRVIKKAGKFKIVEENDADDKVKKVKEINAGIYLASCKLLLKALEDVEVLDGIGGHAAPAEQGGPAEVVALEEREALGAGLLELLLGFNFFGKQSDALSTQALEETLAVSGT